MPRAAAIHAPAPEPLPVLTPGPLGSPLEPRALRLDYRTACQPVGASVVVGEGRRTFLVVTDGDRARVTCKACLR